MSNDPDWDAGIRAGYKPYHVHLSYDEFVDAEAVIAGVGRDGFRVWPNTAVIEDDGRRITATVLVRYGGPGIVNPSDLL